MQKLDGVYLKPSEVKAAIKGSQTLTEFKIQTPGFLQEGLVDSVVGIQIARSKILDLKKVRCKLSIRNYEPSPLNSLTKEYLVVKQKISAAFGNNALEPRILAPPATKTREEFIEVK